MAAHDIPSDEWRMYVIAKEFGIPPSQQDDEPAVALDWLLAIHDAVAEVKNDAHS